MMGGTLIIKNTLIADNQSNGTDNDVYFDSGTITDNGYNIVKVSGGFNFTATGDQTGTGLTLNLASTLADNNTTNGTQTLKITNGSVAINAGNSSSNSAAKGSVAVPSQDQRGAERNGTTDIGSYEFYDNDGSLPVELKSFTANANGNSVELNWQTATEVNNYGFEIQRSVSSGQRSEYEKIGFVEGHGNSNSPKSYSFTDVNPPSGKIQYRLKQIDVDGEFEYSDEVEVNISAPNKFELAQNYPNPFNPTTTIKYSIPVVIARSGATRQSHEKSANPKYTTDCHAKTDVLSRNDVTNVSLVVYDLLGHEVATLVNKRQVPGNYSIKFDASNLASGIYFYRLQTGDFIQTRKMVLMK
jgi:hypothetical protein